ncbi:MAG: ABC-F family ATP-binding cassette domain-containing protein [Elusimicrobia bacterium]|nr:ABC-F family ATP-binding cassette domain-containing protein [Elusimicrobiota bacterium]
MITVRGVHKAFGSQTLLEDASLQINEWDRYALVGPNGSGKSTLFRMLLGEAQPDKGAIQMRQGAVVGYLAQENAGLTGQTVLNEALNGIEHPEPRLAAKAKAILMGLGFKISDFDRKSSELSGGWAMRAAIARLLVAEPDLLLLDEPTNHLDLDSLLWFQEYLQNYSGAIFLISHDRSFINAICQAIVSVENHKLRVYHGDYEFFVQTQQAEREKLESQHRQQQIQIEQMEEFIARNRARLSSASRAQSMMKRLEKLERIELPQETKKVKIRFPQPLRAAARAIVLTAISKSYGEVNVYRGLDFHIERGWKAAFVGHNGAGKSTLLKILAGVVEIDSGERTLGANVRVGYYSQHRAEMFNSNRTVYEEALSVTRIGQTEEMIRTVLGTFLFPGDSVKKKVNVLSGGEKSRLALVKFLLDPPNVLLMDEPTTHLDMNSIEALIGALSEFEGTLGFISHDIYFINSLANHVVHVEGGKVALYPGNYDYFQHRQGQIAAEAQSLPNANETPRSAPSPNNKKEERRQRAQEQDRLRQIQRNKKETAQIEIEIARLAKELENPEVHADFNRVKTITDQIQTLQDKLSALQNG